MSPAADGGPRVPQGLVDAIAAQECVLFAGAGIGAAAGFPYWRDLLRTVLSQLVEDDPRQWEDLRRQLEAGEPQLVAELLRSRLPDGLLLDLVRSAYRPLREPSPPEHEMLVRLRELPWAGAVTNVWGPMAQDLELIGDAVRLLPQDELDPSLLVQMAPFLLKAYGDLNSERTFLFSFEDYRRAVSQNRSYELFLGTLFSRRTLLFLGTSIEGVEQFCIGSGLFEPAGRTHYAVVPEDPSFDLRRERISSRFSVTLLGADPDQVPLATAGFAARLARAVERRRKPRVTAPAAERIRRVMLEDIGPFDGLDLVISSDSTTALLGDNGSGKTTVLRAIALALCGSSAATIVAPSRLLRSGQNSGQITIETTTSSYTTTLRRERELVRSDSRQVTAVESGSLLAIGVPSLRGMPGGPSSARKPSASNPPSASDLLPLVQNQIDPRLGDLKAWVVRNHLVAQDPKDPSSAARGQMLKRFFDILGRLTPGIDFEFHSVDADAGEVLVDTVDGTIPLELLSQGMASMLSCVGVLLQRLFESKPAADEPDKEPALMLVDELDAHLHPLWQWRILPLLREQFEHVQFIATTHSPLVVAQSRPNELVHVRREDGRLVATHLDQPFAGWRSDQILTHPLFGLDTTMDQDTATDLENYRRMLADPEAEPHEVRDLAARLGERLPGPEETVEEREATQLLKEFLDERFERRLRDLSEQQRTRIAEAAQLELTRMYGES